MQNFFELFNLPVQFDVDGKVLDTAYRHIQRLVHPDRFVTATEAEKRAAMQYATMVNDAYQTLKDPLKRAMHLCALNGVPVDGNGHAQMDAGFLMEQMAWRERLEMALDANNHEVLQALADEQKEQRENQLAAVKGCLDTYHFEKAVAEINKLMFLNRLGDEIHRSMEKLVPRG
ncbi:MAG: Fe-S protein assembly co-chaperone HscB [Oxalobacter sp.]